MDEIETERDLARGLTRLLELEPGFAPAVVLAGRVPLRRKPPGFGALLDAIVSQQVSTASAAAIAGRMRAAGLWQAAAIRAAPDAALLAAGLSRPKARYVRALAEAGVDYPGLQALSDEAVVARLTRITGIGRWSAELYLLQSMGRPDVLPAGDLALQEASRHLFALETRPKEPQLRAMARGWAPVRAVAARVLWAYYGRIKQREGVR